MAVPSPLRPTPLAERDGFDLPLDPRDAERRRTERLIWLNTREVPRLRAVGTLLILAAALAHNSLVLGEPSLQPWLRLAAIAAIYCSATWYLLHLFYADARKYLDVGVVFLTTDLWLFALVMYATGAERSWLFFLPLFRVVDQTPSSFRRSLAFAHLGVLSYLGVILYAALVDHRSIPPGPEIAKLLIIYGGGPYIAMVARSSDERQRRLTGAIRFARRLIGELEQKGVALEASSRDLREALQQQARLARENADLYAAAQREKARQLQIFDSTSDGIIFVSPEGRIEAANVRSGELLGFSSVAVIGTDLSRIVSRLYSVGDGDSFVTTLRELLADPWKGGSGDLQQPATDTCCTGSRSRPATGRAAALVSPSPSRT